MFSEIQTENHINEKIGGFLFSSFFSRNADAVYNAVIL